MNHIDNVIETDGALILGAGIAGLFTALKLAPFPTLVLAGSRPGAVFAGQGTKIEAVL